MNKQNFIFKQSDIRDWDNIKANCFNFIHKCTKESKQDFCVKVDKFSNKRSNKQLAAYWLLIASVKRFMDEQGNNYTEEQISDWFKIKAGHETEVMDKRLPKSISDKSDTTKDEMKNLINTILDFGLEYGIDDCQIDPVELRDMLNFYKS